MKKRTQTTAGLASQPEFEHEVDCIAQLQVSLQQLAAERTAQLHSVEENYGRQIASLEQEIKSRLRLCATYADAHRAELFEKDKKSGATPLAQFGFRDGQPRLALLAKWTWDKVLDALDKIGAIHCIRTKQEVDREILLVDIKQGVVTDPAMLGVKVVQDEPFWVAPKADEDTRNTAKAKAGKAGQS